jgi:hypothetical protein
VRHQRDLVRTQVCPRQTSGFVLKALLQQNETRGLPMPIDPV